MLLIDEINQNLKKFDFNLDLESAVYNLKERILYFVFRYSDSLMLNKEIKDVVEDVITQHVDDKILISIKYKKNYYDEDLVAEVVLRSARRDYPIISIDGAQIKLTKNKDLNLVEIMIDKCFEDFVLEQGSTFTSLIEKDLKETYFDNFAIKIDFAEGVAPKVGMNADEDSSMYSADSTDYEIEPECIEPYIGELIDAPIYPIASYKFPVDGVALCGKIEDLTENHTKAKVDEDGKERASREYYTFNLSDFSGKIRIVYFPGKVNLQKFKKLENGSEIVVFGNVEEDKFQSGLSVRPKVINLMISKKGFYEQTYSMPVPKKYTRVFPEPYVQTTQEDLFGGVKEIQNEYLLANDFVVFDLETTGVNYSSDKIIEIGAVKIVQGKLVETFGTLVNPERKIPADATKANNITDEDVKDAPTLREVMPDFFKFCDGCIMVSYVIGFDFNFIEYHGKSLGYAFTNKTDDAFVMAKQKLKGLKNYKLTTVAKQLGVSLENAHRAVFDAVATGEVMIKLLENF